MQVQPKYDILSMLAAAHAVCCECIWGEEAPNLHDDIRQGTVLWPHTAQV